MGRPDGPPKGGAYPPGDYQPPNQALHPQFQGMDRGQQNPYTPGPGLHPNHAPEREERPSFAPSGAEGGSDQDVEDGYRYRRTEVRESSHFYQRSTSTVDEVTEQTPDLLTSFIAERMHRDGMHVPQHLHPHLSNTRNREVGRCLQMIGDELANNRQLNRLIDCVQVTPGTAFDTFASVAARIFEDGNINWGRIVTLFYFGYRLALQCISEYKLIQTIIDWVCRFIAGKIAKWISDRGGWGCIKEYFGSTTVQMAGVFLAGCVVTFCVLHFRKS